MKESYRLQKNNLSEILLKKNTGISVFIIYTANKLPVYNLVYEKMGAVLKRLEKIVNEIIVADT